MTEARSPKVSLLSLHLDYVKCQCYECTALRPNVSLETTILIVALCDFIEKVEGLFPFTRRGKHGLMLCALRFCFRLGAWN